MTSGKLLNRQLSAGKMMPALADVLSASRTSRVILSGGIIAELAGRSYVVILVQVVPVRWD